MKTIESNFKEVENEYNGVVTIDRQGKAVLTSLGSGKIFTRNNDEQTQYRLVDLRFCIDGEVSSSSAQVSLKVIETLNVDDVVGVSVREVEGRDGEPVFFATVMGLSGEGMMSSSFGQLIKAKAVKVNKSDFSTMPS